MTPAEHFFAKGWVQFDPEPVAKAWVTAASPLADEIVADPKHRADWLRCGGTWFAGVNVFPNDATGAVPDRSIPPLEGSAVAFIARVLGLEGVAWDQAQISVCYPGYPQPGEDESDAAFRFRRDRAAAHVDGILPIGPDRRRMLGEAHGFVLGLPLNQTPPDAAPLVVWEGSHEIIRAAFRERLEGIAPADWAREDVTDAYTTARRAVFDRCPRVAITVPPGAAYIVHRLAVHGVAPWGPAGGQAPRSIAYFRPELELKDPAAWLDAA